MLSFVTPKKRKDAHNASPQFLSKGKVRVVEHPGGDCTQNQISPRKPFGLLSNLPSNLGLLSFRGGGVKILSVFRNGKDIPSRPSPPSSFTGGNIVPFRSRSTAPSSIASSGPVPSSAPKSGETHQGGDKRNALLSTGVTAAFGAMSKRVGPDTPHFSRKDGPRIASPSIATVEKAVATKIFLESHFNHLLSTDVTPRSMRRRNMERNLPTLGLSREQQHRRRQEWYANESYNLREMRVLKSRTLARQKMKAVAMSNFEILRVLGKGSFGVVRLVREKSDPTGESTIGACEHWGGYDGPPSIRKHPRFATQKKEKRVYAMKVIRKSDMLRNSQEGHLRAERDFLVASENSRWVVPLIASFQDNHNLYLVMEYQYVAEMILCIEETHKMNWIHRDVKPDNFLISASGHLKISDFGLSFDGHWIHNQTYYNEHRYSLIRQLGLISTVRGDEQDCAEEQEKQESKPTVNLVDRGHTGREQFQPGIGEVNGPVLDWLNRTQRRQLARSVVGTSQYMAPEWSIGIILYEVRQRYARPRSDCSALMPVSFYAMDLIMRLLESKEERLSCKRYRENDQTMLNKALRTRTIWNLHTCQLVFPNDAEDIKRHPFFRNIQWSILHLTRPPFIPRIYGNQPIDKFFDDEADILSGSDHLDSSSLEISRKSQALNEKSFSTTTPVDCASNHPSPVIQVLEKAAGDVKRQEKENRARDKLLRDPQVGRTVLEIRKRGAFIGYTYRRPQSTLAA
ncbi:kinase-like protein [Westerdykella ornata]|uniref:non-specific serine/threonine protein kinase n=1 Tax=Westerdykella ornata TaxID=318751 RepID=A0A6A6J6P2_WESOR|nr:kinase-like protein [Westerdykella ornata]KAF2272241.1 kinase-like protein [Westerdykella ornata]